MTPDDKAPLQYRKAYRRQFAPRRFWLWLGWLAFVFGAIGGLCGYVFR